MNPICEVPYPHGHILPDGLPNAWEASINDPVVRLPWPDRLKWKSPQRSNNNVFQFGWFASHSKFQLPWKIDFNRFTTDDWEAIAAIIAGKFAFRSVYGIPRGGQPLARALDKYCEPDYPILIVDDVLTTRRSFVHARAALGNPEDVFGVVVCARGPVLPWIWPIMVVSDWAQSRGTGLG